MQEISVALQESFKISSRQDSLRLLESLNLFIAGSLSDLEILHDEITALVELRIVVGELLKLEQDGLLVLVGLVQISLSLGLFLGLVNNLLGLGLNGCIRFLDKILVRLLSILFGADCLGLHGFCIIDNLLNHAHHTTCCRILLVLLESWR